MKTKLTANENVYWCKKSHCWYAEWRLNRDERWEKLGSYGSKSVAIAALVKCR